MFYLDLRVTNLDILTLRFVAKGVFVLLLDIIHNLSIWNFSTERHEHNNINVMQMSVAAKKKDKSDQSYHF